MSPERRAGPTCAVMPWSRQSEETCIRPSAAPTRCCERFLYQKHRSSSRKTDRYSWLLGVSVEQSEQPGQVRRQRRGEVERLPGDRVAEAQGRRVERLPG